MYFFGITVVVVVAVYKLQFIDIERHYITIELLVIKFTGRKQSETILFCESVNGNH